MILQQAYENTFGIYDYISQAIKEKNEVDPSLKEPLSSVQMQYAEDYCNTSRLYELIRLYTDLRIYNYFKVSLSEFLEYPHDLVEHMLRMADDRNRKESKQNSDLLDDLKEGLEE